MSTPRGAADLTVGPGRFHTSRVRPELLDQSRPGEHVWIATVAYRLADDTVTRIVADGTDVLMEAENVAMTGVGCFVCEEPLTQRMLHRRCPGEPRGPGS